ncbi:MAG: hypothetical protein WA929_10280 [Pseudomonas neustonica]
MNGPKRPPIDPQEYLYGINVVDIGDLRIARGKTRREPAACNHLRLNFDDQERRIYCQDCEQEVDHFDAFITVVNNWRTMTRRLDERRKSIDEAEQFTLVSRAAKELDKAWRKRKQVPCCPSCNAGLLPEDFANGIKSTRSAEFERAKRKKTTP